MRILVAVSNATNRRSLSEELEYCGAAVTLAPTLEEALDQLASSASWTAILCDGPPAGNPNLLEALERDTGALPPVLILTSPAAHHHRRSEWERLGAVTSLLKPVTRAQLLKVLSTLAPSAHEAATYIRHGD